MKNWILKHAHWIFPVCDIILAINIAFLERFGWLPEIFEFKLSRINFYFLFLYGILLVNIYLRIVYNKKSMDYEKLSQKTKLYEKMIDTMSSQTQECINKIVIDFAKKLGFSSDPLKCDRLTIFGLRNFSFFALSRYSENPVYEEIHSKEYPIDKGCIAKGYQNDWHFEVGSFSPYEKDKDAYERYMRQTYGYNHSDVRKFHMKSRFYAVKRIRTENGKNEGMVVFESIKANRFPEEYIRQELEILAQKVCDFLTILDMKAEQLSDEVRIELDDK